jgi:hypothetical protein
MRTFFLLGSPKRRNDSESLSVDWECNIIMYFREIGFENVDWIHVAQDMTDGRFMLAGG